MQLTFAETLDRLRTAENAVKFLDKVDPTLAELLRKDLTSGDVHQPTALGNEKNKKKPKISTAYVQDKDAAEKAWNTQLEILKLDPEQKIIYGWASVSMEKGKYIVDKQDDIIFPEDLEKAAEEFVLNSRAQGDMHQERYVGRLVASLVTTPDICKAFGLTVKDDRIGWIVGFKVDDPALWHTIKSGERPEFSIGGAGVREQV